MPFSLPGLRRADLRSPLHVVVAMLVAATALVAGTTTKVTTKPAIVRAAEPTIVRATELVASVTTTKDTALTTKDTVLTTKDTVSPASPVSPALAGDPHRGRELFTRTWYPQTLDVTQGDGLGPYFNDRSCAACHKLGGVGGAGPNENNVQIINTRLVDLSADQKPEEFRTKLYPFAVEGVMVLHRGATLPEYGALRLVRLQWAAPCHPEVAQLPKLPASQQPRVLCCGLGHNRASPLEERNTPALFGAGLIDRVTLATLESVAAAQGAAVRGRPVRLPAGEVGRFGWKGQNASLRDFCENACAVELGLETPRRKQTPASLLEPGRPTIPDVTDEDVADLTEFVASLPAPRHAAPSDATDVSRGEEAFQKIGLAACHTPNLGDIRGIYGDLLLHRVGTSGSGFYGQVVQPNDTADKIIPPAHDEFRTPPLWGLADTGPYLHDGTAPTIETAIRRHAVQAAESVRDYGRLGEDDRRVLLAFLGSLRAPDSSP